MSFEKGVWGQDLIKVFMLNISKLINQYLYFWTRVDLCI